MTTHNVPSLRGLHALSALRRHGSHRKAAEALGITRSALSHRIAELEAELGAKLTLRIGRNASLTEDAVTLLAGMGDALDKIENAVAPFRQRGRQLRLSTVDTFATNWLLPRLSLFREEYPEIELAVLTTQRAVDLEGEDIDCAIRHGSGNWPDLDCTHLFDETLAPVGLPSFASLPIERWPIIKAKSRFLDWNIWAIRRQGASIPHHSGMIVENRSQALEAALAGIGIALTDERYVDQHLAKGRLVRLGPTATLDAGYHLVRSKTVRNRRFVEVMLDWLRRQVNAQAIATSHLSQIQRPEKS